MMKRTISGMIGAGSLAHNRRDFVAENVDPDRVQLNICYQNENLKEVYKELFDDATERYNVGKRKDRQIANYYEKIRQGKQEKLFHEVIFQIGNREDMAVGTLEGNLAVKVLDEYVKDFQKRNPTLRVFSCYLHQDEATPHTGATGAHQSGILISKTAMEMLFSREQLEQEGIPKRTVKIKWQNDFETESCFTYYASKNELRITRFGRGFPFLHINQTGSLFVFTKQAEENYSGYFLDTEEEIEEFLNAFGISPTETNSLINVENVRAEAQEQIAIQEFIANLEVDFPTSEEMSATARYIQDRAYDHIEYIQTNPDRKIIDWTNMEYTLFRALEYSPKYLCTLQQGISGAQMDEMQAENVVLVVPEPYIVSYPKDRRDRIWTIARFVKYIQEIEG